MIIMATSKKRKPKPSQSETPRVLDRGNLLLILEMLAEAPEEVGDDCLDGLADVAYKPRNKVRDYYNRRRQRSNE
jgi:hypothetical protein